MIWLWRSLTSVSATCTSQGPLWRQLVARLAMRPRRWSPARDTTVSRLIFGAAVWYSTLWFAVIFHLRTQKLQICTRKSWEQNTLFPSSYRASAKTSLEESWTQIPSKGSEWMTLEIILGPSWSRTETEIWAFSLEKRRCLLKKNFSTR